MALHQPSHRGRHLARRTLGRREPIHVVRLHPAPGRPRCGRLDRDGRRRLRQRSRRELGRHLQDRAPSQAAPGPAEASSKLAIVRYVAWFNNTRLHESLDDRPPREIEELSLRKTGQPHPRNEHREPTKTVSVEPRAAQFPVGAPMGLVVAYGLAALFLFGCLPVGIERALESCRRRLRPGGW